MRRLLFTLPKRSFGAAKGLPNQEHHVYTDEKLIEQNHSPVNDITRSFLVDQFAKLKPFDLMDVQKVK